MTEQNLIEFSRPIAAESVGEQGRSQSIEATPEECDHLARRLGLDAVLSLSAELILNPKKNGRLIHLEGGFRANIRQTCVITLDFLDSTVEGTLDLLYDTSLDGSEEDLESFDIDGDASEESPPEPVWDGHIDIGEAVTEQLALEIDPFPRTPGVSFDAYSTAPEDENSTVDATNGPIPKSSPFAGLAQLKEKLKK
ncbi:MAG: DUF177 domain-containing protein [Alphaproteobacteria bacterium]|jgi:hypothetical protein|nr:DUF177 domain-containing protein [Alphaproteobacteria bacterium]